MNHKFQKLLSITTLLLSIFPNIDAKNCNSCKKGCAQSQNTWLPRALSADKASELLNYKHALVPTSNDESWFGEFSVMGKYQKSFNSQNKLGVLPLWSPENCNQMSVGDNSGNFDLDLYQVGMGPVTTNGFMSLCPSVYQAGADFFFYIGSHKTARGFFFKIHAPVGLININPKLSYSHDVKAVAYPSGALNHVVPAPGAPVTVPAPNTTIGQAFMDPKGSQNAAGTEKQALVAMENGLIGCKRTSSAKFGDLEIALGYNIMANEKKHVGIALCFAAPTGNKAEARYMLEPIFGRNGHWAAGAELMADWKFWDSKTSDRYAQLLFDGSAMHLFTSKTRRSFDLKGNGLGSKYLLLARYSGATFQNEIVNAVNISTIDIQSSFAVEGDFAIALDFHFDEWSLAVGYNGWGRSCETLMPSCSSKSAANFNNYAVLGRQTPYNEDGTPLNLCEPKAKIGKSQDRATVATSTIVDATSGKNRLPELIADALDIDAQAVHAVYTSKAFIQGQYTWRESEYNPYIALSTAIEFPHFFCKNGTARFWHIGVQGGIAF